MLWPRHSRSLTAPGSVGSRLKSTASMAKCYICCREATNNELRRSLRWRFVLHALRRPSHWSFERLRHWHGCGRSMASGSEHTTSCPRFTAGSWRASALLICGKQESCSKPSRNSYLAALSRHAKLALTDLHHVLDGRPKDRDTRMAMTR